MKDPICPRCHKNLRLSYFTYCLECRKELRKTTWRKVERIGQRRNRKRNLRRIREELKNKPCTDCGVILDRKQMEFDHVPERGPKLFDVSRGFTGKKTVGSVLREIAKCDLVCCFCHRKRTSARIKEKKALSTPLPL